MFGIVVIGHGKFASGITSSLNLLIGKLDNYVAIDFLENDDINTLEIKFKENLIKLKDCKKIAIYTDLRGGTPFNIAIKEKIINERLEVIGGANLTSIISFAMGRLLSENFNEMINNSIIEGKEELLIYNNIIENNNFEE